VTPTRRANQQDARGQSLEAQEERRAKDAKQSLPQPLERQPKPMQSFLPAPVQGQFGAYGRE